MAPKRKDKDNELVTKQKPDAIQADNEIFLQAFESEYQKVNVCDKWTKKRKYKQKPLLESLN